LYVTISNRSICFLPAFLRFLCVRLLVPWRRYEFHVYAVMMQRVRILMSALNWACVQVLPAVRLKVAAT